MAIGIREDTMSICLKVVAYLQTLKKMKLKKIEQKIISMSSSDNTVQFSSP